MIRWYDWVLAFITADTISMLLFTMFAVNSVIGYIYFIFSLLAIVSLWDWYCQVRYGREKYK